MGRRTSLISCGHTFLACLLSTCFQKLDRNGQIFQGRRSIEGISGKIYIHFDDIRDACFTLAAIMRSSEHWTAGYFATHVMTQVS